MKDAILIVCIVAILAWPFIAVNLLGISTKSNNSDGLTAYDVIAELAKRGVVVTKLAGFNGDARVSRAEMDHMLSRIDNVDNTAKKAICAAFLRQYFSP